MDKRIFIELKDGKVRDAKMVTLDELVAEGWERDAKQPEATVSSAWVQDVSTSAKLKDELCEIWRLKNIVAHVSVNEYPPSKQVRPLFGFAKDRLGMQPSHTELNDLLRDIKALAQKHDALSTTAQALGDWRMLHSSEEEAALAERARTIVQPFDLPDTKLWSGDYNTRRLQQVIAELENFLR